MLSPTPTVTSHLLVFDRKPLSQGEVKKETFQNPCSFLLRSELVHRRRRQAFKSKFARKNVLGKQHPGFSEGHKFDSLGLCLCLNNWLSGKKYL